MRISLVFLIVLIISYMMYIICKKPRNISKKIEELIVRADGLKTLISNSAVEKNRRSYEKKLKKVENKIENLKLYTISKTQYSQTDKLCYKLKITRRLLLATTIIALTTSFFAIYFYKGYVNNKERANVLWSENFRLNNDLGAFEAGHYETIGWLETNVRIVVADENSPLFRTYHSYDCDKWQDYSYWVYKTEQVVNNDTYIKCPDCN